MDDTEPLKDVLSLYFDPSIMCLGTLPDLFFVHTQNVKNKIKISTLSSHANKQTIDPSSNQIIIR